jgi:hypothetical protein
MRIRPKRLRRMFRKASSDTARATRARKYIERSSSKSMNGSVGRVTPWSGSSQPKSFSLKRTLGTAAANANVATAR